MDTVVAAIVSGLLGGGIAGAVIGGLVTLRSQHRAFDQERRTRFLDLKRERYSALLLGSDEWFRAQWRQMDAVDEAKAGRDDTSNISPLPSRRPIELMSDEIELLAPPAVGDAASRLVDAIRDLSGFDQTDHAGLARMQEVATYGEVSAQYTGARNRFIVAAKVDLGTD